MRGLPFPQDAAFDRETSYEYGTPASNVEDIPIDPALADPAIDPNLQNWGNAPGYDQNGAPPPFPQAFSPNTTEYSQGPQGDPFAPAPEPAYFRPEEQARPQSKPVKRKRRAKKEPECGFCHGNNKGNKQGQPEAMVSCDECGRSGHPTCMHLSEIGDQLHTYPWKCLECKACEICQEKGDDNRILFCDSCDRGWHMDCLTPPLEDSPPGKWYCPTCTENPAGVCGPHEPEESSSEAEVPQKDAVREPSVASSSRSQPPRPRPPNTRRRKGKRKAIPISSESEPDVDVSDTPRGRTRQMTYSARKSAQEASQAASSPVKRPQLRIAATPPKMLVRIRIPAKGKGKEKEESSDSEEEQKGLFDDILDPDQRDTSRTSILKQDKIRFDKSRQTAESKLVPSSAKPPPSVPETPIAGPSSRPTRSSALSLSLTPITPASGLGRSISPTPSTPGPSGPSSSPGLRIRTIRFGSFDIQTWYDAPFPEEYANIPDGRLWLCEFCLKYNKSRFGASRHRMKCKARHPPGDEIYRDGAVSIFEVDGRRNKIYCQNLCLLSKMFLDHKSLFYDVEPFLFYVMTEVDDGGARFVGYFSKEKRSPNDYNVSCIMTLPVRQRQGWGNLLIEFSYLLSKKEQRLGSPEKPLSGLGALGYKNYWTLSLMRYLHTASDSPHLEDISRATSMTLEDIYTTLLDLDLIDVDAVPTQKLLPGQSIRFPKGRKNGVARRHLIRTQTQDDDSNKSPFVAPTQYHIHWDPANVDAYLAKWESKGYLKIKPEKLKWSPFLLARVKKSDVVEPLADESALTTALPSSSSLAETPTSATPGIFVRGDGDDESGASPTRRSSRSPYKLTTRSPEQPTTRRLRSQAQNDELPTPAPAPGPVRRRTTRQSTSPTKSMRPRSPSPMQVDDSAATREQDRRDAAFAAQLAREEMPRRLLRSRSATSPELKRSTSTSSKNNMSRKRRRIDSSPEPEPDAHSLDAQDTRIPSPTRHPLTNGFVAVDVPLARQRSRSAMHEVHLEVNGAQDADGEPEITLSVGNGTGDAHEDVKSEFDSGTPFTAVMSRQSAPSDDTTYAAGAPSSKGDVDSPVDVPHSAVEGEDGDLLPGVVELATPNGVEALAFVPGVAERDGEKAAEGNSAVSAMVGIVVDAPAAAQVNVSVEPAVDADAEGEDADAEGEDEDAEGDEDPDAEGEDEDAEGEPDTELL